MHGLGQSAFPRVITIYRRNMNINKEVGREVHEAKTNPLQEVFCSHELSGRSGNETIALLVSSPDRLDAVCERD